LRFRDFIAEQRRLVAGWAAFHNGQLEPERTAFVKDHLDRRDEAIAQIGLAIGIVFHLATLFLDPLLVDRESVLVIMRWVHVMTLAYFASWVFLLRPLGVPLRSTNVPGQILSISGYVYLLFLFVRQAQDVDMPLLRMWVTYLFIATFQILVTSSHSARMPSVMAMLYSALAVAAWWPHPMMAKVVAISALGFSAAAAFHFGLVVNAFAAGMREYEARRALAAAEKSRHERDLDLAREIQDSLAPAAEMSCGSYSARCFQKRHRLVGGDWAAMRVTSDGALHVLVTDAAGNGVQAALVVHAVQSLWAETIGDDHFDPRAWMVRVNRALFQMSGKQSHMVTMGVLTLTDDAATYWSAGHLPVFAVAGGEAGAATVRAVQARGNPLGLTPDPGVEAATIALAPLKAKGGLSILLGSDGVFVKGTALSPGDIVEVRDRVRETGAGALAAEGVEDDKTLVWIEWQRQTQVKGREQAS
jgi:hypothetical protein